MSAACRHPFMLLPPPGSAVRAGPRPHHASAMQMLAAKKILSAPVVAGDASDGIEWPQDKGLTGKSQIQGFVDVRDILNSFLLGERP